VRCLPTGGTKLNNSFERDQLDAGIAGSLDKVASNCPISYCKNVSVVTFFLFKFK